MSALDDMTGRATGAEAMVMELRERLQRIELECLRAQRSRPSIDTLTETILAIIEEL